MNNDVYTYQNWQKDALPDMKTLLWADTSYHGSDNNISLESIHVTNWTVTELNMTLSLHDVFASLAPNRSNLDNGNLCTVVFPYALYTWAVVDCDRPVKEITVVCEATMTGTDTNNSRQLSLYSILICPPEMTMILPYCYSLVQGNSTTFLSKCLKDTHLDTYGKVSFHPSQQAFFSKATVGLTENFLLCIMGDSVSQSFIVEQEDRKDTTELCYIGQYDGSPYSIANNGIT